MLGGEDFILSQRSGVSEELFKGSLLGVDADVASGPDLRLGTGLRSLAHLPAGLEPSPRFLERVAGGWWGRPRSSRSAVCLQPQPASGCYARVK